MPRTTKDGKDIKLVLSWLCKRPLVDAELAGALHMPSSNYSRRKDAEDYPTFEELTQLADHFDICKRALQIVFGYLDEDAVQLLDERGMAQYVEMGGGVPPFFPTRGTWRTATIPSKTSCPPAAGRRRRSDAPPGI